MRSSLGIMLLFLIALETGLGSRPRAFADIQVQVVSHAGDYGNLDLTTGDFQKIATVIPSIPGVPRSIMVGMGYGTDGQLYGMESSGIATTSELIRVDRAGDVRGPRSPASRDSP